MLGVLDGGAEVKIKRRNEWIGLAVEVVVEAAICVGFVALGVWAWRVNQQTIAAEVERQLREAKP